MSGLRRASDHWWGQPFEVLAIGCAGLAGGVVIFGDAIPGSMDAYLNTWVTTTWGVLLMMSAVLVYAGLAVPLLLASLQLRQFGLTLAGAASLAYAPIVVAYGARGAWVAGLMVLGLGATALWQSFLLSREQSRIEANLRHAAEGAPHGDR